MEQLEFNFYIEKEFYQYHKQNPEIYEGFKQLALSAVKMKAHFGAKAIFEVLRWNTAMSGNDEFKINNNYTPLYARMFERDFPEHLGFFRKRKSKFDKSFV